MSENEKMRKAEDQKREKQKTEKRRRGEKKKTEILINQTIRQIEKKRNNLPTDMAAFENCKGEIAELIKAKVKYLFYEVPETEEEFLSRANQFFMEIVEENRIPTWEDFCLNMGVTRETVFEWINTESKGKFVSNLCKKSREILASMESTLATQGKIQPVVWIFRSKNFYGMQDQAQLVISNGNAIEHKTEEELREKYADIINVDLDDDAVT